MDRESERHTGSLTLLEERITDGKRYVLLELTFRLAALRMIYAEDEEEAACEFLSELSREEATALLERIAEGGLAPYQLYDVAAGARELLAGL